jgi:hypothetical protein
VSDRKRADFRKTLPYAFSRIIEEDFKKFPSTDALGRLLAAEHRILDLIEETEIPASPKLAPHFLEMKESYMGTLEILRSAKQRIADQLRLNVRQREALGI